MLRLLLCCLAAALIFVGCGDSSDSSDDGGGNRTTASTPARTTAAPRPVDNPLPKPKGPGPHPGAKVEQLVIKDITVGTGAEIQAGDTGVFDFIGANWITGEPLDASWGKKRPFETVVDTGVVIDGWWQGIPGMRVGGRRTLLVPPSLGFPAESALSGATTYFDVVLRAVIPAAPAGVGGGEAAAQ